MSRDIIVEIERGVKTRTRREAWINVNSELGEADLGHCWSSRERAREVWGRQGYRIHVVLETPEERECRKWYGCALSYAEPGVA
jgi:hypothetical protein